MIPPLYFFAEVKIQNDHISFFIFIDIYNFKYIFLVSKFYKNLVKWALTEIEWSVAGTTTLDREWIVNG